MKSHCTLAAIFLGVLCHVSFAGDWPAHRGNAQRNGYVADTLPRDLSLRWTYTPLHSPRPAWSSSPRMGFDRAFQTVIANGKLFFGSSADGKLYALDAATGSETWTFYTGAPIRFAPVIWKDRVFVASDDGYLYALAIEDGRLLWKRRGGPDDRMLLGNGKMVSRWPARGGPVVVGDAVYFAAGFWPSEGIYLYALDAASGKVIWKNDDSGGIYMAQPHGGAYAHSGVSAQGYLVAARDRLFMPTGRAVPAAFDRNNGKLEYFHLARYRNYGGVEAMAADSAFINSGWVFGAKKGEALQKLAPGPAAALPDGLLQSTTKSLIGYRWTDVKAKDRRGKPREYRGLVKMFTIPNVPGGTSLIVAGKTAVAGGLNYVSIVDLEAKRTINAVEVVGQPLGLAAAGGRLYVSTDRGVIYCFDSEKTDAKQIRPVASGTSPYGDNKLLATAAEEILKKTGMHKGYCLDLGCGDGGLAYELAKRSKLHIYAVDEDQENVRRAREKLSAAGLYGVRITVHLAPTDDTKFPNHFANLVVSAKSVLQGSDPVSVEEVLRLQRPAGGVACLGKPGAMKISVRKNLDGAGSWTHQYANAANTSCSDDKLIKGRLRVLWYRDADFEVPQRHGRGPAPLYADGRLFHEGMNGIRAADAYNGRTLWEFPLKGILKQYNADHLMGTAGTGSNYCLGGDSLYVRVKDRCLRIAVADGKKLAELPAPKHADGKTGIWGYIASEDGLLFGSLANEEHIVKHSWRRADMNGLFTESVALFALDAKSGKPRWTYRAKHSIRHNAIAIGGGRVYLIDRPLAMSDRLIRSGKQPAKKNSATEHPTGTLLALDAKTGKVIWKTDANIYGTLLALSDKHDALLMSYQSTRFKLPSEKGGRLSVFRASTGRRLWEKAAKYVTRPMINDMTVYAHGGAWDLLSGEGRPFSLKTKSYGCGQLSGCENMMFYRSATLGFLDLSASSGGTQNIGGIRPGCWINAIPAGGIVMLPDASSGCSCSYLNRAWIALEASP